MTNIDTPVAAYDRDEDVRFVRNFHDIFLSIGLIMLIVGLGIVTSRFLAGLVTLDQVASKSSLGLVALTWAAAAGFLWFLAEIFARKKRLFLPAIVIFIGYLLYVLFSGISAFFLVQINSETYTDFSNAMESIRSFPLFISILMSAASLIFYFRMRLPFAMGVAGLAVASLVLSSFGMFYDFDTLSNTPEIIQLLKSLSLVTGIIIFLLGIFYDAQDPTRTGLKSDNAFWLHFFAAPILFSSVLSFTVDTSFTGIDSTGAAIATLTTVAAFALLSLLINRRALLVAGLLSAAIAIGYLINQSDMDSTLTLAITLLMVGAVMVLLGYAWHSVRAIIIAPFPKRGFIARIIPPVTIGA